MDVSYNAGSIRTMAASSDIQQRYAECRAAIAESVEGLDAAFLREVLREMPTLKVYACRVLCQLHLVKAFSDTNARRLANVVDVILSSTGAPGLEERYCSKEITTQFGKNRQILWSMMHHMLVNASLGQGSGLFIESLLDQCQSEPPVLDSSFGRYVRQAVYRRQSEILRQKGSTWLAVFEKVLSLEGDLSKAASTGTHREPATELDLRSFWISGDDTFVGVCDSTLSKSVWLGKRSHTERDKQNAVIELTALYAVRPDFVLKSIRNQRMNGFVRDLILSSRVRYSRQGSIPPSFNANLASLLTELLKDSGQKYTMRGPPYLLNSGYDCSSKGNPGVFVKGTKLEARGNHFEDFLGNCFHEGDLVTPCVPDISVLTRNIVRLASYSCHDDRAKIISRLAQLPVGEVRKEVCRCILYDPAGTDTIFSLLNTANFRAESQRNQFDEVLVSILGDDDFFLTMLSRAMSIEASPSKRMRMVNLGKFVTTLTTICTRLKGTRESFWSCTQHALVTTEGRLIWELMHTAMDTSIAGSAAYRIILDAVRTVQEATERICVRDRDDTSTLRLCSCGTAERQSHTIGSREANFYPKVCDCRARQSIVVSRPSPQHWFFWTVASNCASLNGPLWRQTGSKLSPSSWLFVGEWTKKCEDQLLNSVTDAILTVHCRWEIISKEPYDPEKPVSGEFSSFLLQLRDQCDGKYVSSYLEKLSNSLARVTATEGAFLSVFGVVTSKELERRLRVGTNSLCECLGTAWDVADQHDLGVLMTELKSAERILRALFPTLRDFEHLREETPQLLNYISYLLECVSEKAEGMCALENANLVYVRVAIGYPYSQGLRPLHANGSGVALSKRILQCFSET